VRRCFGPAHLRELDWRTVWSFKDRLPRGAHYKAALAMDPDLADKLLEREDDPEFTEEPAATPEGYTTETYLLLSVIDALMGVQAAVIAAAGADPPSIAPMPRPITALDEARERKRMRNMQALIDQFTQPSGALFE
jgi:hypothetical protein